MKAQAFELGGILGLRMVGGERFLQVGGTRKSTAESGFNFSIGGVWLQKWRSKRKRARNRKAFIFSGLTRGGKKGSRKGNGSASFLWPTEGKKKGGDTEVVSSSTQTISAQGGKRRCFSRCFSREGDKAFVSSATRRKGKKKGKKADGATHVVPFADGHESDRKKGKQCTTYL